MVLEGGIGMREISKPKYFTRILDTSNYNTMFGPICIKTITKQLCVNDTSDMINISLHYDSVMADNYSTDTNMHICIKNA